MGKCLLGLKGFASWGNPQEESGQMVAQKKKMKKRKYCLICGKLNPPKNEKYCSKKCTTIGYKKYKSRENSKNWLGNNYTSIRNDRHGNVFKTTRDKNGVLRREHVVIAEKILGRKLRHQKECVHHINGNSLDNSNANLLICSISYHNMLHWKMSELYAKQKFGRLEGGDTSSKIPTRR